MNGNLKKELPLILLVLIPFLYLGYIWNSLPEKVPIHWNAEGQINGWGSKSQLVVIPLLLPLLMYVILWIAPLIDPKKKLKNMGSKFDQLKFCLVLFMSVLASYIIYSAKSQSLQSPNTILILVGLLFTVIGNYFPSMKPNYFIGIRTPWTLENETIWKKTHQLAGKLWFWGGILIIILCLTLTIKDYEILYTVFLTVVGTLVIVPVIYSIIIGRKEDRDKEPV